MEIQELEYCKYKVNYSASDELISEKRRKAIEHFKKYNVPGFRKGKATDTAIKTVFKNQINEFMKNELINNAHDDILFETKMRPIGQPVIEKLIFDGNKFECSMVYSKKPDFELKQYKGIEVVEPHINDTPDSLCEKYIQEIRISNGDLIPYGENDSVKLGDKVTLSYTVSEGESNEGLMYAVGSNQISQEFDQGILGMLAGEERAFDANNKNYVVKLHMGLTLKPASLDDELAKKVGFDSVANMYKAAEATAHKHIKIERSGKLAEQIKLKLIDEHKFECPTWLVTAEAQALAANARKNWNSMNEEEKTPFLTDAEKNVRFILILDAIREQEKETNISDAEAFSGVRDSLLSRGLEPEQVKNLINNGYINSMIANFKNSYTTQWLIDNAKVIS